MNQDFKKLKRGLKDLSPLFQAAQTVQKQVLAPAYEPETATPPPDWAHDYSLVTCSIFYPHASGAAARRLNAHFRTRLSTESRTCSVISIRTDREHADAGPAQTEAGAEGARTRHFTLSWEQFVSACARPLNPKGGGFASGSDVLLFDFSYPAVPDAEKILPLVDKWVLITMPTLDSVTESYRLIKESRRCRADSDYYMVFDSAEGYRHGEELYDKLSVMVEKKLGVQLNWMGSLDAPSASVPFGGTFDPQYLFIDSMARTLTPEKCSMAQWARTFSGLQPAVA